MGRILKQIWLLTKKNFILQIRRPLGAIFELLLPCVFLGLISLTRYATPIEDHCFSYFEPLPASKFAENNNMFSVIAMAPDSQYVRNLAAKMVLGHDILDGYVENSYTEEEIKEIVRSVDLSDLNPMVLIKQLQYLDTTFGFKPKTIAIMPTVEFMQETLVQNAEFFTAGIEFSTDDAGSVDYTLRLPASLGRRGQWLTDREYPYYFRPGPETFAGYDEGWVALQQLVDRSILLEEGVAPADIPSLAIRQMPYPTWQEDGFANAIRNSLPLMIVISFLWIGASISKELVFEKASRMKETMKMMGLSNWILWLSWIIQRVVLMMVTVLLMTIVLKAARYLLYSGPIIIYIFLFEYALSVMCFCFFLSTLFSKTTTAIAGTMLGYFVLYIPYFFLGNEFDNMDNQSRYLSCLFSSTCMGFGANIISKWETMEEGLQFSNVGKQTSDLDLFTMGDVMLMLFIDIIIYSLMTWYVEAVFPGEFGIKQKPWFFVTKEYWFGSQVKEPKLKNQTKNGTTISNSYNVAEDKKDIQLNDVNGYESEENGISGEHEKGPKNRNIGIEIKNLAKRFNTPKGKITAVDGLTLEMYEGQITSLLGHNGAGKTTTMSMLTGLYSPSGGDALVNGNSILSSMDKVRESLGICPQHNVLFDRLTVAEHLEFFINLKGYTGDVTAERNKMIEMLKLKDKINAKGAELSGGMKRKLSVGIALAGGSKVIILDEPTAGMDPYARRATWDLILENKKDRTILLTTHYMDEADFLGDRVAIMATGRLVCSGSSMFLKKRYGVGYHLTCVKSAGCDAKAVESFIKGHVGTAQKISNVGSELVFILPETEIDNFVALFKTLEVEKTLKSVKLEGFGLSLTTLEEVFMKVGESSEDKNLEAINARETLASAQSATSPDSEKVAGQVSQFRIFKQNELNSGFSLLIQQLTAMITKRFINSKRYKKGIIVQLVLPVLFGFLGLLVVKTVGGADDGKGTEPLREISLSNYPGSGIVGTAFIADFSTNSDYFESSMLDYLQTLNLASTALDSEINTAVSRYSSASYTADQCCQEPALQLATTCTDKGDTASDWDVCTTESDIDHFGYHACTGKCFSPRTVNETCGDRPVPDPKYIGDKLSFFANVLLNQIQGDVKFYRKKQVAFTFSTVPKFVDLLSTVDGSSIGYNDTGETDFALGTLTTDPSLAHNVLTGWFSHEGLHLAPGVQNALSNMLLIKHGKSKRIQVSNRPLPQSLIDRFQFAGASEEGGSLSVLMLLGFSFLTSSFVLFVVEERENKSKHLQEISGVNGAVYWVGTFAWDMINYIVCVIVITILFAVFDIDGYGGVRLAAVFLLLTLYGFASIPFVYLLSLAFSSAVSAFSLIVTFTFIIGLAGFIANLILTFQQDDFQETLELILIFLPNFDFIQGLNNIYGNGIQLNIWNICLENLDNERLCRSLGLDNPNVFDLEGLAVGKQLLALFVVGVLAFTIVVLKEVYGKSIAIWVDAKRVKLRASDLGMPPGEDSDVQAERTRVMCEIQKLSKDSAVTFTNLRKSYGKKQAVQNLTLGIPKNECFGLLGVNGAGKTTTFSMLTGDISMTGGEAYVAGYDIKKDIRKIQQRIGYCPQFDALIGIMTGRELLRMFANMRGIPKAEIEQTVNEAIKNLNLETHADKLCGGYSGGNKRKLSTAIALVGNPEVLFLDEPTAGMDPTARRFLWTVLADLTASKIGTSIVLTTHSMEECEALCSRLVIMVNGAFRCLGSIQHLKSKYGAGYTITLTMPDEKQEACADFIADTFPGAVLKEEHLGYLHFELTAQIAWSFIFEKMEENKGKLQLEDYAVNQTSLEQVFLNFAKDQTSEDDMVKKKKRCFCCKSKASSIEDSQQKRFSKVSINRTASASNGYNQV